MRKPWIPLAVALAALALVAGSVLAAASGEWQTAQNLSNTPGRSSMATQARNPLTGDLFVVWTDEDSGGRNEIMSRRWDGATRSWFPGLSLAADNLSQSRWEDAGPLVFFDSQGQGILVWTRRYLASDGAPADRTEVLWRTWQGSDWSGEAVLMHVDTYLPGSYGLLPVETPDGILLFITFDNGYRTTTFQGGAWSPVSAPQYLVFPDGTRPILAQILRDDEGLFHAAAYGQNSLQAGLNIWFHDAYYLTYDGSTWTPPVNLSYTDGVADSIGLGFDHQGNLHFLWSDPDSVYSTESLKSAIWERVYDGVSWTPNVEVTAYNPNQAIDGFSLTTDSTGALHLAWSEGLLVNNAHTDLDIYYRTGRGLTWDAEENVHTSGDPSRYPVLVAGDGDPALVWQEGPISDRDVYFSHWLAASGPCQDLAEVSITAPATAVVGKPVLFTASVLPLTATYPLTYTWQAGQQETEVHTGGFVDMVAFTWTMTASQAVTVTVENCGRPVSSTHHLALTPAPIYPVYLPLVLHNAGP